MNTSQQIRMILANDQLSDLEKVQSLRALIPPEVAKYPIDKLSSLPSDLVEPFERGLEVARAVHRISKRAVADKIQEN